MTAHLLRWQAGSSLRRGSLTLAGFFDALASPAAAARTAAYASVIASLPPRIWAVLATLSR